MVPTTKAASISQYWILGNVSVRPFVMISLIAES